MLPAFQVQVLICTGISGSSPDIYWHFGVKSWYVPAFQVQVRVCIAISGSSPDMYRHFRFKTLYVRHFGFKSWYVPAFRVQVLIYTGISGSSPDMYRRFRFKSWTGSIYIDFVVCKWFNKENRKRCECRYGTEKLKPGQNINCLVGRSVELSVSVWNTRHSYRWGHDSFSSSTYMFV
jgi:hypothetical protein